MYNMTSDVYIQEYAISEPLLSIIKYCIIGLQETSISAHTISNPSEFPGCKK